MPYKLHIDMVPGPIWGHNLRSEEFGLGRYRWDKLRKEIIGARGRSCAICRNVEEPHGHEVWKYTTTRRTGIAKLIRIMIICRPCHQLHHWGLSVKLVGMGQMDEDRLDHLMEHFCRVNECKPSDFRRHMDDAMDVWQARSELEWTVDWGPYKREVERACADREARTLLRQDRNKTYAERIRDGDGPPPRTRKRTISSQK